MVVAEIGSPAEAVVSASGLTWTGAAKAMAERPRDVNSNKGKFGHVLVVGGSYGKAGAPAMASLAALRTGAGLVTAAVPKSIVDTVARVAPELMMVPLAEGAEGAVSFKNLDGGEAGRADEARSAWWRWGRGCRPKGRRRRLRGRWWRRRRCRW